MNAFGATFKKLEDSNVKYTLKQTSLEDAFLNFTNVKNTQGSDDMDQEALNNSQSRILEIDANIPYNEISCCKLFWM